MTDNNKSDTAELDEYINYLIKGNGKECLNYVKKYLEQYPDFIRLYEEVLKKSLYIVGEMWEYNRITVATEHLATSITGLLLNHVYEHIIPGGAAGKKIILATTENEEHQVGIRMVADVFEKHKWEAYYLGANMPARELMTFIKAMEPDMVAISLSLYFNISNLENMIFMIRSAYPELPVIAGGQAFMFGGMERLFKFNNVTYIPDLYSLEMYIENNT